MELEGNSVNSFLSSGYRTFVELVALVVVALVVLLPEGLVEMSYGLIPRVVGKA